MGVFRRVIDPFGAPEVFCQDAIFEIMAPGFVRVTMVTIEGGGEAMAKVKLMMPLSSIPGCITSATTFVAMQAFRKVTGDDGAESMLLM